MEKIRRDGYSEELINAWLSERNEQRELRQASDEHRLSQIRRQMAWYIAAIVLVMLFMVWEIRTCYHNPYR